MNSNDLDVCVIFNGPAKKLTDQLDQILKFTKVNYRLIAVLDAAGIEAKDALRAWMAENRKEGKTQVVANPAYMGLSHCIRQAIQIGSEKPAEYVAIFHPGFQLHDRNWLNKITLPFKDTSCSIVTADPLKGPSSDMPRPMGRTESPIEGLAMMRRPRPEDIVVTDPNHPWMHTASEARKKSRRLYVVPSLRCSLVPAQAPKVKAVKVDSKPEIVISR